MLRGLSVMAMLAVCSLEDLKKKQIWTGWMICFAAEGILGQFFIWKQPVSDLAAAMLPGAVMVLLSFAARGGIGTGDGLLLMTAGLFVQAEYMIKILMYASFFSAGCALFLYVVKKKSRKYEMPFVPFLFLASAGELLFQTLHT